MCWVQQARAKAKNVRWTSQAERQYTTADQISSPVWFRNNYHHSSAIAHSIDTALSSSGLAASDMHLHDIYSCFPIVPKLAAQHLSLPLDGRLTLLGGLTFFGGAGNNYSMHVRIHVQFLCTLGTYEHRL